MSLLKRVVNLPETPNIDKCSSGNDYSNNQTDTSIFSRSKSSELCEWTNKLVEILPSVDDAPESESEIKEIVKHFKIIKTFYTKFTDSGFDPSPEIEAIYNSIQIYESVMSICFVLFHEHPRVLASISEQISKAIKKLDFFEGKSCCLTLMVCAPCLLRKFGTILSAIDENIGQLGIPKVAEFVSSIIEIFCRLFNKQLNFDSLVRISESIQDIIGKIGSIFRNVNVERKSKWSPLDVADKIRAKTDKFQSKSPIVLRTVDSFAKLFKSIDACEASLEKRIQSQRARRENSGKEEEAKPLLAAEIESQQIETIREIGACGRFFQHLETVMTYGILVFSNEDELLTPILDNLDECSRVLDKFGKLHVLYKILCGKNYLSKIKVCIANIIHLLETSRLKFNSPQEFVSEIQKTYPNLVGMLFDLAFDGGVRVPFPINDIQNFIHNAVNGGNNGVANVQAQAENVVHKVINNLSDQSNVVEKLPDEAQKFIGNAVNNIGKNIGNSIGKNIGFRF